MLFYSFVDRITNKRHSLLTLLPPFQEGKELDDRILVLRAVFY